MITSADDMHAVLIGLSVVGVAVFLAVFAFVWLYDRRQAKRETRKLREFVDSQEWPR